jgi:P27 family predicted phage terminase small subunit
MGKRGPRPIPTSLKIVRGTARGKDKHRHEPTPRVISLRCPKDLPEEAQRIFRRLSKVLIPLGLLTVADHETFELMCLHGGLARRAAIEMAKEGLTVKDERNLDRKSPLNQMLKEHSDAYRRYAALFGLSPSARSEIDLPEIAKSRFTLLNSDERRFFGENKLSKYLKNPWSNL